MTTYREHGQCLCGAVHIHLSEPPLAARICWCSVCRHYAGNGSPNILVKPESVEISGSLETYTRPADSGNQIVHAFCGQCGSQIYAARTEQPPAYALRVGNMDNQSRFTPQANIWTENAPEWACFDAAVPKLEKSA